MPDIEEIRRRRMAELMSQQGQEQAAEQMKAAELERQITAAVAQILSPEAKERLGNIRSARPEYARQVEVMLIQLANSGKLQGKLTDEQFKGILNKIKGTKRDTKITFR